MTEQEYEAFKEFINDTLENMTIEDYHDVIDSLDIPRKGNRLKGGCHHDLDELQSAGYNVALIGDDKKYLYCHICEKSYNLLSFVKQVYLVRGQEVNAVQVMKFICSCCDIPFEFSTNTQIKPKYTAWKSLKKYLPKEKRVIEDKIYDESILDMFDKKYYKGWIDDHISIETMIKYDIRFYERTCSIVIPCRNDEGKLIGLRSRFLRKEDIELHKYFPTRLLDGTQYNFSVGNSLYGLWMNKDAIKRRKKVVIGEAEKFTLQCDTYYGDENISVSLYGKTMSDIKKKLLLQLGVTEVILALDYDYFDTHVKDSHGNYLRLNDGSYVKTLEFEKFIENIFKIANYFKSLCKVTALVSYGGHKMKDSPTDNGKEWYERLYHAREEVGNDNTQDIIDKINIDKNRLEVLHKEYSYDIILYKIEKGEIRR